MTNSFDLHAMIRREISRIREKIMAVEGKAPEEPFDSFSADTNLPDVDSIMTMQMPIRFSPIRCEIKDEHIFAIMEQGSEDIVIRSFDLKNAYLECFFEPVPRLSLSKTHIVILKEALVRNSIGSIDELMKFTEVIMKEMMAYGG